MIDFDIWFLTWERELNQEMHDAHIVNDEEYIEARFIEVTQNESGEEYISPTSTCIPVA